MKKRYSISAAGIALVGLGVGVALVWPSAEPRTSDGAQGSPVAQSEQVELQTADGVQIVGDLYTPAQENGAAVILLHMMNRDRASWKELAQKLVDGGYLVLAIDLRGHGESVVQNDDGKEQLLDYQTFSDAEHQASSQDVVAAREFIEAGSQKIGQENILLVGASIGANLALEFLAESPAIPGAVLLSPGANYRGIAAEPAAQALSPGQSLYIIAGGQDAASAAAAAAITRATPAKATAAILAEAGAKHGTDIIDAETQLQDEIVSWIDSVSL